MPTIQEYGNSSERCRNSSLVRLCRQVPCSHEKLPAKMYEGSAIIMKIASCRRDKQLRSSERALKARFCEWRV